jgi:hypothetical protein
MTFVGEHRFDHWVAKDLLHREEDIEAFDSPFVNYQVFLTVGRDPRDGELNVSIGLQLTKGRPRDDFSLTTLLAMEGADVPEARLPLQVFDQNKIGPFLERLALEHVPVRRPWTAHS